jgi:hypothetical protein
VTDPDRLAQIAAELACRVRDEAPADNLAWLDKQLPDTTDRRDLLFVLAAAIPVDQPWLQLTAWTELRPHGTHAAAQRHRYHREPLCDRCREGERTRDRNRKRVSRQAAA